MNDPITVTIMTGAVADATARVFDRILQGSTQQRVTGIVPKRGRKKSRAVSGVSVVSTTERLMRLGQGCSCCTVRSDLMTKVQRIAEEQTADHIVIQATPQSDLRTLAKTFTVADDSGSVLSEVARIEGFVAVLEAGRFFERLNTSAARAHIEHIEIANLVVVEGAQNLSGVEYARLVGVVAALNPDARVERADEEGFALDSLRVAKPFDLDAAEQRSMEAVEPVESENGIVRFVFQARRPFHPARLHALLAESWDGVLRAEGSFWVASQPGFARNLDVAGGSRESTCTGMWWATVPESERPDSPQFKQYMDGIWHPQFGDRHQAISIVGVGLDEAGFRSRLEACLLTEAELADVEQWHALSDPFDWPEMEG